MENYVKATKQIILQGSNGLTLHVDGFKHWGKGQYKRVNLYKDGKYLGFVNVGNWVVYSKGEFDGEKVLALNIG